MASTAQKENHDPGLASKLDKLKIPQPSSSISPPTKEFEFSEVFGSQSSSSSSKSLSSPFLKDPEIIYSRSHSFVGPSPRVAASNPLSFDAFIKQDDLQNIEKGEDDADADADADADVIDTVRGEENRREVCHKIGPGDFEILRVLGRGWFGKVFLVRKKGNGDDGIFAMKVIGKHHILKFDHVDHIMAERNILTKVVHPFIVQLWCSFQTKSKLYLILDFINGGHLFYHLHKQGMFSEDEAKLYTAEIVSAVSHLHKIGIVHRDLKPENILMDANGHAMLTDFGLSKELDESGRSNSWIGSVEYMAPEIILGKSHNKDADWWSVGIILYEMLTGKPPFEHKNGYKLQQKITQEKVKLPPYLTSEAHSLIKGLLQKDPLKRLGSGTNGGDDIKRHKWFRPINWKKLEARELQPKYKPDVSEKECTANFDGYWTEMPAVDSPAPTPTAGDHFRGYTYIAPNSWLSSGRTEG